MLQNFLTTVFSNSSHLKGPQSELDPVSLSMDLLGDSDFPSLDVGVAGVSGPNLSKS